MATLDIASQRELFVDSYLVDKLSGEAAFRLHNPIPREVVLKPTEPWESRIGYITVFVDEGRYRMYYKSATMSQFPEEAAEAVGVDDCIVCYAKSADGIHWEKPNLGIFEFAGNRDNNIIWKGRGSHGFAPFKDTCPTCPPEEQYKAFGRSRIDLLDNPPEERHYRSLFALTSPDGIHWKIKEGSKAYGAMFDRDDAYFDSQNVGFWDEHAGCYRAFMRKKSRAGNRADLVNRDDGDGGIDKVPLARDICTSTSPDFENWTTPQFLSYPGAPIEELYTNMIIPYYRAPHILFGFPARYVENRGYLTSVHEQLSEVRPGRFFQSYTDGLFMCSRDGQTFHRWGEPFLQPGMPESSRWAYGECFQNWGIVETAHELPGAPNELSFYISEGIRLDHGEPEVVQPAIRRHTLRQDGFVSIHTARDGGELITKTLTFTGSFLSLNMRTSAAGSIQIEIQDAAGAPIDGFALPTCPHLFGNSLDRQVVWTTGTPLEQVAGTPIRLRFVMQEADLYSLHFHS